MIIITIYKTRIKARNDRSIFNAILKLSWGIKEIIALAKTAPAKPAIAKINIKKRYSPIENPKKYINKRILIEC